MMTFHRSNETEFDGRCESRESEETSGADTGSSLETKENRGGETSQDFVVLNSNVWNFGEARVHFCLSRRISLYGACCWQENFSLSSTRWCMKARRSFAALQLAISASSLIAVSLAIAMTFPTPPLFDLQLIYSLRPGLLFWSQALGAIGL